MSTFFLIWQDPESRRWLPVGRLDRVRQQFVFGYTRGAAVSPRFVPFGNLSATNSIYVSNELFPIFANRVMNEKRPEYRTYARWSGFDGGYSSDPLLLMARMGGNRATDTLQVYPVPERTADGRYYTVFFAHGLSHLPMESQDRSFRLQSGDRLFPMLDVQNPHDSQAVALRTSDPTALVGYAPRHLAPDIRELGRMAPGSPAIRIKQVNQDAPAQYRVLCEAEGAWPANFQPCASNDYQTLVPYSPEAVLGRLGYDAPVAASVRR